MRQLSAIFLLFIFTSCTAQKPPNWVRNADDNTLLWEISGNGLTRPSFLFGTFHLLCKDDIQLSKQLQDAMKSSDFIYMEMDMDDPATMLGGMMYMNMKNGQTLEGLYSEEDYARLKAYFSDTLKMPMMMFRKMKPYFLVALLYPRMMSCSAPSGVEQELIKIAKEDKKEIKGLETMQFQASVFDSIPYEWQAKELLKNIDSFRFYRDEFNVMVDVYKNQQMDSLGNMMAKSEFGGDAFGDILLNNRNKNWVSQLDKQMKDQSVFVAVGAGHLPGKSGVIELLRKAGYTVTPLKNKD